MRPSVGIPLAILLLVTISFTLTDAIESTPLARVIFVEQSAEANFQQWRASSLPNDYSAADLEGVTVNLGGYDVCSFRGSLCEACMRSNDENLPLLRNTGFNQSASVHSTVQASSFTVDAHGMIVASNAANAALKVEEEDVSIERLLMCATIWGPTACSLYQWSETFDLLYVHGDARELNSFWTKTRPYSNETVTIVYVHLPRLCNCTADCPVTPELTTPLQLERVDVQTGCSTLLVKLQFNLPVQRYYSLAEAESNQVQLGSILHSTYVAAFEQQFNASFAYWSGEKTLAINLFTPSAQGDGSLEVLKSSLLSFLSNGSTSSIPSDFLIPGSVVGVNRPESRASVSPSAKAGAWTRPQPEPACKQMNGATRCGLLTQASCTASTDASLASCIGGSYEFQSTCTCLAPWNGPVCNLTNAATKVDFGLKFNLDFSTLDQEAFKSSFPSEIAKALGWSVERVLLMKLAAGSVVATTRLLSSSDTNQLSPIEGVRSLQSQLADPNSPLRQGQFGKSVDPTQTLQPTIYVQCEDGVFRTNCVGGSEAPPDEDAIAGGGGGGGSSGLSDAQKKGLIAGFICGAFALGVILFIAFRVVKSKRGQQIKSSVSAAGSPEAPAVKPLDKVEETDQDKQNDTVRSPAAAGEKTKAKSSEVEMVEPPKEVDSQAVRIHFGQEQ